MLGRTQVEEDQRSRASLVGGVSLISKEGFSIFHELVLGSYPRRAA